MRVPAVMMRGGTSRGLYFHERDLPADPAERDRLILKAYGSPDPYRRQLDGVGGATSPTSKVAIIGASDDPAIDVTYTFGQVSIDRPLIDWTGTCGNISSGVGPFAVDEALVEATPPVTTVRFLNTNTNKVVEAHVPTRDGRFDPVGDLAIPGVPGTGAPIQLDYLNPGGAVTGRLLPTGATVDTLHIGGSDVTVSLVDAANPLVFIRLADVGLTGKETLEEIDGDPGLLARLEAIRATAGVRATIGSTAEEITASYPSVPKVALIGPPLDYQRSDGAAVDSGETSLRIIMLSMGRAHPSVALTGAMCTAVAAKVPGTLVHEAARADDRDAPTRLGHPAGVLTVGANPAQEDGDWSVDRVAVFRTARRLFEGFVYVD